MTLHQKRAFLINLLFYGAVAVLAFFLVKYLFAWMFPFVLGLVVAVALQKPVDYLTKKTPVPRAFWSVFCVLTVLVLLITLVAVLGKRLYAEMMSLFRFLPDYAASVSEALTGLYARFSDLLDGLPASVRESMTDMPKNLLTSFAAGASSTLTKIFNLLLQGGPALIVAVVVSVVACCFMTKDYYLITGFLRRQLPPKTARLISEAKRVFVSSILKMIRGYLIMMAITFAELTVGFLALRVDFAVAVALLVSVVDLLPVLGTGTVLIPWGIVSLITGNVVLGVGLLVLYVIILIVRNILEPRIIGRQVGLPPVVTLMSMYFGLQLFGLAGLFLVPVAVIVIKNLQDTGHIRFWKDEEREAESA